jgi:hydroxyacylglutathione hydrolase
MFEGTPGPMWAGLAALRDFPNDTLIYCGHEYSAGNAAFALSIDPDNEMLKARAEEIAQQRAKGEFTIPVTLGAEKSTNPFLRADDPAIASLINLPGAHAETVFAAVRKAKDNF